MFSPDGMTLFYSFGVDRGSDLFALDPFRGGAKRRVTAGGGSENISPSFSPDGRRFAFASEPGALTVYRAAAQKTTSQEESAAA